MASHPLKHLLDIESTSDEAIHHLLNSARAIREEPQAWRDALRGRLLINLFYEPSTRTRVSFEIAARRLGMEVVNVAADASSVVKGESLRDTFSTLQAMQPDVMVSRHPDAGAHEALVALAGRGTHLVNAGDGNRAHPTQALLDVLTIQDHFDELSCLKVLIAGDLRHSRVTGSGVALLKRLGVEEIRLAAPAGLQAGAQVAAGTRQFDALEPGLQGADVVMMLRVQRERFGGGESPIGGNYHQDWGLTGERLALAAPHAIVMHPGPLNRGVEIDSDVADGPQSVILEQVRNGVFVRMAVLLAMLGPG